MRLPLLVSGEPGSGKTQLGFAVAHELGKPAPFKFVTKSTSVARDLFYEYDAVRHFRASQANQAEPVDVRNYLTYSALGLAVLLALPIEVRQRFIGARDNRDTSQDDSASMGTMLQERLRTKPPQQSVVVIDEIDKAPRDFPNDLLDEVDTMTFRVPELGGLETPVLPASLRPIVFVTTNSERQLPDAFLRRCAYVNIRYPVGEELDAILASRLDGMFKVGTPFLKDVRRFFEYLRKNELLDKNPGVSELIQFLLALGAAGVEPNNTIAGARSIVRDTIPLLGKSKEDIVRLLGEVEKWTSPD
jgi:MoxR-like ATPase